MRAPGPGRGLGPRPGRRGGGPGGRPRGAGDPGRECGPPGAGGGEAGGRERAREEGGGGRGSRGGSEPRGGRGRGRWGAPRPPKEESGSHLLPRTRGEAAAAGGAPAPARFPPRSRAPASLRARCCSRPPRPPKRSPGPGRAGGGRGASRGAAGARAGATGTLSRRRVTPAARRRGARKVTLAAFAGCRRPGARAGYPRRPALRAGDAGRGLGRGAGL